MPVKTYHKLVRDRIPEIIEADGKICICETLSDADYIDLLDQKLNEELAEYRESKSLEELADLLEVMQAVVKARGWTLEELEQLDGVETAVLLIEDNEGTITRYGVVYDNGMQLSQLYDGKHLPCYHYEADMTAVGISSRQEPENSKNVTWVYLPASKGQIERAMQRSGIADPKDMRLFMADSSFPEEVDVALDFQCDNIHELNELALAVEKFSIHDRKKLGAAVSMAKPENASQIRRLAENMDLFEFAPGAHTPEEYGKYMIQRSGHFEYDPNLDEFYDYERYGLQHMDYQSGVFTDRGYIAYVGTVDLEELMSEDPVDQCQREQGVQMGGMT